MSQSSSAPLQAGSILERMSDGFYALDADWRFTYVNARAEQIWGMRREELLGSNIWQAFPRSVGTPLQEEILAAAQEQRNASLRLWSPVLLRWLDVDIYPDAAGLCVYLRDVTEQTQAQQDKQRLLEQVQEAVRQQRAFLRDVLFSVTEGRLCLCDTEADLPAELPLIGEPLALSPPALSNLRRRVEGAAVANCLPEVRWQDLTLAAGEAAMNAIRHGGGGEARVGGDGQKTVQVWIQDQGTGIAVEHLPRATLEPGYSSAGTMGHGFWIMLKTCDRIYLLTGPTGTTLVLEQDREEPPPSWLRVAETMGVNLDEQPTP